VPTTATKPAQDTPQLATRIAELSRDLFVELGEDPRAGGRSSRRAGTSRMPITQLTAQRIDTFGYSSGLTESLQSPQQTDPPAPSPRTGLTAPRRRGVRTCAHAVDEGGRTSGWGA
jgi:hypothetical protein